MLDPETQKLAERMARLELNVRELARNNIALVREIQRLEQENKYQAAELERRRSHICYVPLEHQAS